MSANYDLEYFKNQCKIRDMLVELEREQAKFKKLVAISKIDKTIYQPWPPNKTEPVFFYKHWTDTFGTVTVFTDIILIQPFFMFKAGWHFNKVIIDLCKCTITFQNIAEFIPNVKIRYKEYVCNLNIDVSHVIILDT